MNAIRLRLSSATKLLVPLALCASLALNIYFAAELRKALQPAGPKTLAVGTQLRTLEVRTPDGNASTLQLDGPVLTVLYLMSPNCPWCSRNIPALRALVSRSSPQFRFLGVSSIPLTSEQAASMVDYPVHIAGSVSLEERRRYGFSSTPQTIVVRNGIVTASWAGAYVSKVRDQIEGYFRVRLPSILPESPLQPKGS
jgi:hypothetical protein